MSYQLQHRPQLQLLHSVSNTLLAYTASKFGQAYVQEHGLDEIDFSPVMVDHDIIEKWREPRFCSSDFQIEAIYSLSAAEPSGKIWWHGTREWNVLSIMKYGLRLVDKKDKEHSGKTENRFGNAIYFSDNAFDALQHSSHTFWTRKPQADRAYLFGAIVDEGNVFEPKTFSRVIPEGFDTMYISKDHLSIFADNQLVVRDPSRIRLKYLVEFLCRG